MEFNDLLAKAGIEPKHVLVMRHCPTKSPGLLNVFPWLVTEQPALFEAYQQTQGPSAESALAKASFLAAFFGHEAGKAVFIGLYKNVSRSTVFLEEWQCLGTTIALKKFGWNVSEDDRASFLSFYLKKMAFHDDWIGRLIVSWSPPERSWYRWAYKNRFDISAITQESLFSRAIPDWKSIALSWQQLQVLPQSREHALQHWRGIYFILDKTDGRGYVGSAYGSENILGRWLNYAATGHGGNKQLKKREPSHFRFSILERVSPDLEAEDVIRLEASWKDRLHTREFGLNEN